MISFRPLLLSALALLAQPAVAGPPDGPAPDAEHRLLAGLAGEWTVEQSFWATPGKPPKIDTGHASLAMILNGRHLRQSVRIDDGSNFEGLGYFGYDPVTKAFFSTWMDVNFPGIVIARGALEPATRSVTLRGRMSPAQEGNPVPVREVLTVVDGDHLRYEFYETHKGVEVLSVRLEYTRATRERRPVHPHSGGHPE